MAGVRDDRRRLMLPERTWGSRSPAVLVMALLAVLAAIALLWNMSRRSAHRAAAPAAASETAAPPPAAEPTPAAAVAPAAAEDAPEISARKQAEIGRVINDGRPDLRTCYQRALVRDEKLVHGEVTVRLSVAPSGRVDRVNVVGARAFRVLEPCLEAAVSKWTFPTAAAPYEAEFPLVLHGRQ